MYPFNNFFALILLFDQSFFLVVLGQGRIEINTESDIPTNGHWEFDCPKGYANYTNDFDCGEYSGKVTVPPEDLNEQIGFWTVCLDLCRIKYAVQDHDTSFAARMYQNNLLTEIVFDGIIVGFIEGKKWVDIYVNLEGAKHNEISLRFDHFSENYFTLLEKIVINGELDPPSTHFPTSTLGSTPTITTEKDYSTTISITSLSTTESLSSSSTMGSSTLHYTTTEITSSQSNDAERTTVFSPTPFTSKSTPSSKNHSFTTPFTLPSSTSMEEITDPGCGLCPSESSASSISTNTASSTYLPTSLPTQVLTSSSASTLHTSVSASQSTEGPQPPQKPSPNPPQERKNQSFIKEPWLVFVISSLSSLFFVSVLFICIFMHPFFKKRNRRKGSKEIEAVIS